MDYSKHKMCLYLYCEIVILVWHALNDLCYIFSSLHTLLELFSYIIIFYQINKIIGYRKLI